MQRLIGDFSVGFRIGKKSYDRLGCTMDIILLNRHDPVSRVPQILNARQIKSYDREPVAKGLAEGAWKTFRCTCRQIKIGLLIIRFRIISVAY